MAPLAIPVDVDLREASRLVDQPVTRLRALASAGFFSVARAAECRFTLAELSIARRLRAVPTSALTRLRTRVLGPLTSIEVSAGGRSLTVRDRMGVFVPRTGQAVFDFGSLTPEVAGIVTLASRRAVSEAPGADGQNVASLVARALDCELTDPEAARALYLEVLERHPDHVDANVQLGQLEELGGNTALAEVRYHRALAAGPHPLAATKLGRLLEAQARYDEARTAYLSAVTADDGCVDAHLRLASLYRRAAQPFLALKHQRRARKLTRGC